MHIHLLQVEVFHWLPELPTLHFPREKHPAERETLSSPSCLVMAFHPHFQPTCTVYLQQEWFCARHEELAHIYHELL